MFTGIIEGLGTIHRIQPSTQGIRIAIKPDFELDGTKMGDSIAVNGACLTVVEIDRFEFLADISSETLDKTIFKRAKANQRVNLERALRLSDRIDGHLVSGHIDGTGTIEKIKRTGEAVIITIRLPENLSRYLVTKGSIAVDGISLTINRCAQSTFDVCIIPHTSQITTIQLNKPGDVVNIETDMIGKYIEQFILTGKDKEKKQSSGIDMEFLAKKGFL